MAKRGGKEAIDLAALEEEQEIKAINELKTLEDYMREFKRLKDESSRFQKRNTDLKIELDRLTSEKNSGEEKTQAELIKKEEEIKNLRLEIIELNNDIEDKLVQNDQKHMANLKEYQEQVKKRESEFNNMIKNMNEEIRQLEDYRTKYNLFDDERKRFAEERTNLMKEFEEKNRKALDAYATLFGKQTQDKDEEIKRIREDAKKEALSSAQNMIEELETTKKSLKEELDAYHQEFLRAKKEKDIIITQNKVIKKNVSLQEDSTLEQAIKIKKLKEKNQALKGFIAQETNKYVNEIENLKSNYEEKLREMDSLLNDAKRELRLKVKEIKNLRLLSQMILDQRSEVEQFLIDTLSLVKDEIKKTKLNDKSRMKLPEINQQKKPKPVFEKLDFSILDWEEREKILRVLFSKINTGSSPSFWRSMMQERSADGSAVLNTYQSSVDLHKSQQYNSAPRD